MNLVKLRTLCCRQVVRLQKNPLGLSHNRRFCSVQSTSKSYDDTEDSVVLYDNDDRPFFRAFSAFLTAHPLYWMWSIGDRLLLPSTELQIAAAEAASSSPELQETIVTHPYWSVVGFGLSVGMLAVVPLYSRMYVAKLAYCPSKNLMEITTNEPFGLTGKPTSVPLSEVTLFGERCIRPVEEAQHIQLEVLPWADRMLRGRCLVDRRGTWALEDGEERLIRLLGGTVASSSSFGAPAGADTNVAPHSHSESGNVAFATPAAAQAHELLRSKRKARTRQRHGSKRRSRH